MNKSAEAAAASRRKTALRRLGRLLMIGVGTYVIFAIGLTLFQRRLIYHPFNAPSSLLDAIAKSDGFQRWQNSQGTNIGWQRLSTNRLSAGQVLITHGNAGRALDRVDYANGLQRTRSFDVFILEYPGFGDRAGSPSQDSIFAAATEAIGLLEPRGKIFLIGESLGTGVATYLASTHTQSVAGLLLITPYNNLTAVAQHHNPVFPIKWMLWDRFPSDEFLRRYDGPVGFLLAGRDEVVPDQFGQALYDGYLGPKKLWQDGQSGHNDIYLRLSAEWWQEVVAFWLQRAPAPTELKLR